MPEHAPHGKLPRQLDDGEFLTCCFIYKNFDPRNTEKLRCLRHGLLQQLAHSDKKKGLAACTHRQQALLKAGRLRVGSIYPAFGVTSRLVQRAKHLLCNGIFRLSQPFRSCSKVARTAPGPWFSRLKSSTTKALRPAAFKSTPQIEASSSREPKSSWVACVPKGMAWAMGCTFSSRGQGSR